MVDQDRVDRLDRLLRSAARAHHAEFGGPNPGWPEWYGAFIHPEIGAIVGFEPTLEQVADWLRQADETHRAEAPDEFWPPFYAHWILDTLEA